MSYHTLLQAAQATGLTKRAIQKRVENGQLPATRLGNQWFITEEVLQQIVAIGKMPAGRKPRAQRGALAPQP